MNKLTKDFTVEDWVNGEHADSLFRIQISSPEEPSQSEVQTFSEALSKIKYLQQQYFHVIEKNKSLEEHLYNCQCQIRALQVANVHISEEILDSAIEEEILSLTKQIVNAQAEGPENQGLKKQVYLQKLIIDELMCKLQNMNHRIEYYKEDVTELKTQYEMEKNIVEIEKKNQSVVLEQNHEAFQTIENLKEEIERLKQEVRDTYNSREIQTKIVFEKSKYQVDVESDAIESRMNSEISRITKKYTDQLIQVQLKNQIIVDNLGLCMKKSIDELRNFYEYRISSMIREYSFEESKFYSKILLLKQEISEHLTTNHELEQKLLLTNAKTNYIRQRSLNADNTIKNLSSLLDKMSFEYIEKTSRNQAEIESLQKKSQEVEEDIRNQYKHQEYIADKEHQEAMKSLNLNYTMKIEKINTEFKFWEKKLLERDQNEHNVLLQEISRIEKDKTEIEMQIEAKVQDVLREAKSVRDI